MIEISGLTKSYQDQMIINQLNLCIPDHGILAIMGRSGAGKTTLLRLLAGLEKYDAGEILIDGVKTCGEKYFLEPAKRQIGYVFQQPGLWPHMTVAENIGFGLHHLSKSQRSQRVLELLQQINLAEHGQSYPHQLSGGQAKRVALARSLAPQPKYLFFDEPVTNLDDEGRWAMLDLIRKAAQNEQHSIVYVTHRFDEVEALGAICLKLERGTLHEC